MFRSDGYCGSELNQSFDAGSGGNARKISKNDFAPPSRSAFTGSVPVFAADVAPHVTQSRGEMLAKFQKTAVFVHFNIYDSLLFGLDRSKNENFEFEN